MRVKNVEEILSVSANAGQTEKQIDYEEKKCVGEK